MIVQNTDNRPLVWIGFGNPSASWLLGVYLYSTVERFHRILSPFRICGRILDAFEKNEYRESIPGRLHNSRLSNRQTMNHVVWFPVEYIAEFVRPLKSFHRKSSRSDHIIGIDLVTPETMDWQDARCVNQTLLSSKSYQKVRGYYEYAKKLHWEHAQQSMRAWFLHDNVGKLN